MGKGFKKETENFRVTTTTKTQEKNILVKMVQYGSLIYTVPEKATLGWGCHRTNKHLPELRVRNAHVERQLLRG